MRMRSQYKPRRIRWILALATLAYGLATGVAPALHLSEDAGELRTWLAAVEAGAPGLPGPPTPPPGTHDELDCPMCLMIVQVAHPGSAAPDHPPPARAAHAEPPAAAVAEVDPLPHPDARAPPFA